MITAIGMTCAIGLWRRIFIEIRTRRNGTIIAIVLYSISKAKVMWKPSWRMCIVCMLCARLNVKRYVYLSNEFQLSHEHCVRDVHTSHEARP